MRIVSLFLRVFLIMAGVLLIMELRDLIWPVEPIEVVITPDMIIYSESDSGYGQYDGEWFPIGTVLTSKENGELIVAGPDTPEDEIVAIIK